MPSVLCVVESNNEFVGYINGLLSPLGCGGLIYTTASVDIYVYGCLCVCMSISSLPFLAIVT